MKRRRAPISNINVVPYLDVMLVLLVIFMITAPLFNQGVVNVPTASDDTPLDVQEAGALQINFHPSGANPFSVMDHELDEESAKLSESELIGKLKAEKLLRPDVPIALSVDGARSYDEVIDLIAKLRAAGFTKVALVIRTEN